MKTASISELKAHLSRYLRDVRRGNEVEVLDRGVPVARLVPLKGGSATGRAERERLVREGIITPGAGGIRTLLEQPPLAIDARLSEAVEEDRDDRY